VVLRPGRERSLLRRHPWVFSAAIASIEGEPASGETVDLRSADGRFLGRGAYSPESQIAVRVWTFDAERPVDEAWLDAGLCRAIERRPPEAISGPGAMRLVHGESDGFPGLTVDRYGDWVVCQVNAAGVERWRPEIGRLLEGRLSCRGIFERSDATARAKEGLASRTGVLCGEEPPERVEIVEAERRYLVDVRRGHKTGFYLDQRENRDLVADAAAEREVLDCFAYTGGFTVAALAGGARRVTAVESSAASLDLLRRHVSLNGHAEDQVEAVEGDVFAVLRALRDRDRRFDLVVLDPPKFAESRAQVDRACRGYKDINLLALKLLRSGGLLFTFSCSGHVSPELFQKVVAGAALDARRDTRILRRMSQAPDHPTALAFPEGTYLKGLVCRVD
jgi:23S rRNA (cytosine1962-C5)-methyltransferase